MRILVHSITDLITNSSTVIFTYSDGSAKAAEEMINAIFESFGIDKTFDEVFKTAILCNSEVYSEFSDAPENVDIEQLYEDVKTGKVEKPNWFIDAETDESHYDYYSPSTYLYLIPQKEEYKELAESVKNFLYSTDHEATRDG